MPALLCSASVVADGRDRENEMNIRKLLSLWAMIAFVPAVALAEQVCLYNPKGREVYAAGALNPSSSGLKISEGDVAFDAAAAVQYPLQIQNGMLYIGAKLGPFEGKALEIKKGTRSKLEQTVSATKRDDGSIVAENAFYRVVLDAAKGYALSEAFDKERKKDIVLTKPVGVALVRKRVRRGKTFPDAGSARQVDAEVSATIDQSGPYVVRVLLTWSAPEGEVRQVVTALAGSRIVEIRTHVRTKAPLNSVRVYLSARRFFGKAIIMPDGRRVSATPNCQHWERAPRKVVAYCPREGATLGLLTAPDAEGTVGVCLWHKPEAASNNAFGATYVSRYLAYDPVGTEVDFQIGVLIGGGRDVLGEEIREVGDELVLQSVEAAAVTDLGLSQPWAIVGRKASFIPAVTGSGRPAISVDGVLTDGTWTPTTPGLGVVELKLSQDGYTYSIEARKPVEIKTWWPQKMVLHEGEDGIGRAVVKSHLDRAAECALALTRTTGIDEDQVVWQQNLALGPGEKREIRVEWAGGDCEYGRELCLSVALDGKVVDESSEYTALGDDFPRYVQLTVANAGWFHIDGHQNWYIPQMRRGYTGTVEYYCWAPDHQYDMTPEGDTWEPHTESNAGAYRTTVSKAFLKNMIALAHENGLRVVAELAQFANIHNAMEHPKEIAYTEDGQPWVYNRKVYEDGTEFATVVRNYFTEDRVRGWAEEMNRSVDRFGWDGVRFDCGFLPVQSGSDPLRAMEKSKYESYVWDGKVLRSSYPDPDGTAAQLTNVWRTTTREHKPTCRYHTNSSMTIDRQKLYAKYHAAQCRGGGYVLHENLLQTNAKYDSIDKWAEVLRVNGQNVRDLGGEPAVGQVVYGPRGYNNLMEWIAFSNGYHMFGSAPGRHNPDDDSWKNYRFSLRYCEYFYAPDLRRLPLEQDVISVTGAEGVRWNDISYRRELPNAHIQYIVNFINVPEGDGRLYLHFPPPTPKHNLGVTVQGAAGAKAWALLPEPEPHAVPLAVNARGGAAALVIARLNGFAILVVEIGG